MKNNFISQSNLIIGRNPVMEALKSDREIEYIMISEINPTGSLKPIICKSKELGILVKEVSRKKLSAIAGTTPHQGIIAVACAKKYSTLEDILALANTRNQAPFIIIADGVQDPHNLGAIIRTAECAGVHGIIIPKRRAVGLTAAVNKSSSGALEHMLIAKETNIPSLIDRIKKLNIWVYAAEANGNLWCKQDLTGPIAIVIGSEGRGVSKLVKEKCDGIISIPIFGKVNSLNASIASSVIIYEIIRQRNYKI